MRLGLILQLEKTRLQRHLVAVFLIGIGAAADLRHLESAQVSHRPAGLLDGAVDRLADPRFRYSDQLETL
jgi:hypothetical protein